MKALLGKNESKIKYDKTFAEGGPSGGKMDHACKAPYEQRSDCCSTAQITLYRPV